MYSIYADGVCIYSDVFALENMKVLNPKLTLEDNAAGSLTMTLPIRNVGYSTIHRLTTDISVQKDGKEIWAGRVLQEDKDFYNNRVLYCEGELAFFNDSTQPPGEHAGLSVQAYLERLINVHNSKVPANRQFRLGAVTVVDTNYPTYYTNYEKTIAIFNSLVEAYGGHLRVRNVDGVRYLDYLKDYPDTCSQVIQFGSNLIDFTRKWDSTEFATVIVPLGARLEDSPIEALDAYLTVESVNQGSIYVQSDAAVTAYGWIEKTVTWDDVTDPAILLEKAKAYLTDIQFDNMELELSALDLHYLDVDVEAVKLLDEIRVISFPHGLDRLFPVTKLEIPLDNPDQTQFKMGDTVQTGLTDVNNQTSAAILKKIEGLPKAHSLLKEAKENATQIMNMATTGYITITKGENGSEELIISNVRDYTKADKLWKWNMNGFGYSSDGGKTFGLAMTMDGSIVADYITSGVLNADVIRAGVLRDYGGNFSLDFTTGKLTMKKGSIDIGNGNFTVDEDGNVYAARGTFAGTLSGAKGTFGGQLTAATGDFKGVVQAEDFLDQHGNSMMDLAKQKFTADYLDVRGLNVNNRFIVDSEGNVTIRGGNISWDAVTGTDEIDRRISNAALAASNADTKADAAKDAAAYAQNVISGWCYYGSTYIDGSKIMTGTVQATSLKGGSVSLLDYYGSSSGVLSLTSATSGNYAVDLSSYAALRLSAGSGLLYLSGGPDIAVGCSNFYPLGKAANLGAPGMGMWQAVYAYTGEIQTSDRNFKHSIEPIPGKYMSMLDKITPVRFKMSNGTSNRYHIGFVAQDVEAAMESSEIDSLEFAGWCKDADESGTELQMLRYTEFIGLLLEKSRQLAGQIEQINEKLNRLGAL